MILSFWTVMPGQTLQTQIRLLQEEQSDQGLHCLPFRLHRLDSHYSTVESHSSNFRLITTNFLGVRIFRKFTVVCFSFVCIKPNHADRMTNSVDLDQTAPESGCLDLSVRKLRITMVCVLPPSAKIGIHLEISLKNFCKTRAINFVLLPCFWH